MLTGISQPYISQPWQRWLALELLRGVEPTELTRTLCAQGCPEPQAREALEALMASPLFEAARLVERRRRKLAGLLGCLGELALLGGRASSCPIEERLEPARFYSEYFYANRPVVVRGLMSDWPALSRWSIPYFRERYADCMLEVMADRNSDPKHYDAHYARHRANMTMGAFLDAIEGGAGNDIYLVRRSNLLQQPPFDALLGDFACPPGFLTAGHGPDDVHFWFGGKGTVTRLHHDSSNLFFGQVLGSKRFRLISPLFSQRLYNLGTYYSDVDLERPDFGQHPQLCHVPIVDVTLTAGDFLFIPVGWWHDVRSLSISINLGFLNFDLNFDCGGHFPFWGENDVGLGSDDVAEPRPTSRPCLGP